MKPAGRFTPDWRFGYGRNYGSKQVLAMTFRAAMRVRWARVRAGQNMAVIRAHRCASITVTARRRGRNPNFVSRARAGLKVSGKVDSAPYPSNDQPGKKAPPSITPRLFFPCRRWMPASQ